MGDLNGFNVIRVGLDLQPLVGFGTCTCREQYVVYVLIGKNLVLLALMLLTVPIPRNLRGIW